MRFIGRFLMWCFSLGLLGVVAGILLVSGVFIYFSHDLPDYSALKDYEPPVVTRVHAGDGRLLAEFAQENRIFVPSSEIPDLVKNAFISAEDKNFYTHKGVDPFAIARAVATNLNRSGDQRMVGASTITQQVAKNFLLSNEYSYKRKIREAIVAYRIDQALSKDRILELYLNEIFLGNRSYGVAAAALNYFNKSLDQLTIDEAAYLAALPKAPSTYNLYRNPEKAVAQRNMVIARMEDNGYITDAQAEKALAKPLVGVDSKRERVDAAYFAEEVRREMTKKYGKDSLLEAGLSIRTSVDPTYQAIAVKALRDGLEAYDRRHGYRGPVKETDNISDWQNELSKVVRQKGMLDTWQLAFVLSGGGQIGLADGSKAQIRDEDIAWAKNTKPLSAGQIVMVEKGEKSKTYKLKEVPKVQGAIIAIDPHTGRVLAMQGGWDYDGSEFNRATQAKRQPGSSFKPFVYLTALDKGYTPSTLIVDGPFESIDTAGNVWRPKNYENKYYGPTPLRVGVEKSRNLMTVRLASRIGIKNVIETANKFGIGHNMQPHLSTALGSGEVTLMELTNAYGELVNGGKKITPTFIDRIQDRYGKTVFKADDRPCPNCGQKIRWSGQKVPEVPDAREQIGNPYTIYQMVSILEGVVERGTGKTLKELGRPLAGKTGTTNESKDTWFVGFSPDLVVGVFVGFDQPKPLGKHETGGGTSAPIFKEFMAEALKDKPATPFRIPDGIKLVRVDPKTGRRVSPLSEDGIWEAFLQGTEPSSRPPVIDDGSVEGVAYSPYDPDAPYDPNAVVAPGYDPNAPYSPNGSQPAPRYETDLENIQPVDRTAPIAPSTGTGGLY